MNDVKCSSGVNFYIIESDGKYSRCYSAGFGRRVHMGNISSEEKLIQYSSDEMTCPYNVECNHGCRNGCDYGQTTRFDRSGTGSPGPSYLFDRQANISNMRRDEADVYWHLSRLCNFSCVYCIEPHDPEIDKVMPWELSPSQAVSVMKKLVRQFSHLHLQITGGEPSRHPAFLDIVQEAFYNQDRVTLRILSNMSMYDRMKDVLTLPWMKGKLFIWASCHFSDKRFDLGKFIELCLLAQDVGTLEVSTVDHEHERGFYKIYYDALRASGVRCHFHHQYYDPTRAKTTKFKKDFIPSTLRAALRIIGRESEYDSIVSAGATSFAPAPSLHAGVPEQQRVSEAPFMVVNLPVGCIENGHDQLAEMRRVMVRPYEYAKVDFYRHICSSVGDGIVVEAGVGESTRIIRDLLPGRKFTTFDSCTGTTEDWCVRAGDIRPRGFDKPGDTSVPGGVELVAGPIEETIDRWKCSGKIAMLNIDVQTYTPTMKMLLALDKFIEVGSIVALHHLSDWKQPGYYEMWPHHQWKAFMQWLSSSGKSLKMVSRNNECAGVFEVVKR